MSRIQMLLLAVLLLLGGILLLWDIPQERRQQQEEEREASLLEMTAAEIDTIQLQRPSGDLVLARTGLGAWELRSPVKEPALKDAVEGWLEGVLGVPRIRRLSEASGPGSFEAYGLAAGDGAVSVRLVGAGREDRMWIGRPNPDGIGVYVRRSGEDTIDLVGQPLLSLATASHNAFRHYDLFPVDYEGIDDMQVAAAGVTYGARRDAAGLWHLAGADAPRFLKRHAMAELAFAVGEERVEEFVADHLTERDWTAYGLHDPLGDLRFSAGGTLRRLRLGNSMGRGKLFARRDDESTLLTISQELLPLLERPVEDLLDTHPIPANYDRLDSLRVDWPGGGTLRMVRGEDEWWVPLPPNWKGEEAILPTAIGNAIGGLERLESPRNMILAAGNEPAGVAPVHAATVTLFWPKRTVAFDLRWRSGQDFHWLQVVGESTLHWISRDLYLRFQALGLMVGAARMDG